MPTPIPTISATDSAQSGVATSAAMMPTTAAPVPVPNNAVAIGRPAAITVPNVANRIISATVRPTPSDEMAPRWASCISSPPTCTVTAPAAARSAMPSSWPACSSAMFAGRSSSGMRSIPTLPSRENSAAPIPARPTPGTSSSSRATAPAARLADGSAAPPAAVQTIGSV